MQQTTTQTVDTQPVAIADVSTESKRVKSIDRFRGFCVFCMLVFQFLKEIPSLGFLARLAQHGLDKGIVILPGMTLADIIAPSFIFAIGLTYVLAFNKTKALYGAKRAYTKYTLRALSIVGIGAILATVNKVLDALGGDKLVAVDWVFIALLLIALLTVIFKCVCLNKKISKPIKEISTWMLYSSLALLGLMDMAIAFVDFVVLNGDVNAQVFGYWVTLQNIGMACLIALPLIEQKNWVRFVSASAIFVAYTIYHQIGDNQILLDRVPHGGFLGGFGWGAMLIFDLFVVELFGKNKWQYLSAVALFAFVGLWSTMWFGNITLGSCSPAFILISVGLSGLLFFVFHLTDKLPHGKFDPFVWWGKNPLMMFLVEFFLIGSFTSFAPDSLLENAPLWLGAIEGVLAVVILTTICWLLNKIKRPISL